MRDDAITTANAAMIATPSDSRRSASEKQNAWKQFMNSVDWDAIVEQSKSKKNVLSTLKGIGIPVKR